MIAYEEKKATGMKSPDPKTQASVSLSEVKCGGIQCMRVIPLAGVITIVLQRNVLL